MMDEDETSRYKEKCMAAVCVPRDPPMVTMPGLQSMELK
jgi:hypothetical protein